RSRRATTNNLNIARYAIKEITGRLENDEGVWTGSRNKDIQKNIRQFLFKAIHGALRVGDYWTNIPIYEHRAKCTHCQNESENLEHILLECNKNASSVIWKLAKNTWPTKYGPWPQITLGTILGCGNIKLSPRRNNDQQQEKPEKGPSRLMRIILTESAHLIWTLRCDATINGTEHTARGIKKRWTAKINKRLQLDRMIARKTDRTKPSKSLSTPHGKTQLQQTVPYQQTGPSPSRF
ncbi:hypothetical protein F4604DRAFT_1591691, partial [Suillus subluteus]